MPRPPPLWPWPPTISDASAALVPASSNYVNADTATSNSVKPLSVSGCGQEIKR
jgi:hypothetical protein